jgi:hypothetical protein
MATKGKMNIRKIEERINKLENIILTSNYTYEMGYVEAMTEYRVLCWAIDKEVEDLDRIKNEYLLKTR